MIEGISVFSLRATISPTNSPTKKQEKSYQSCFNSQKSCDSNHKNSSYSSTVTQFDCQPERKGVWKHELLMSRWRQLDSECLHVDPAHWGELLWVFTLWPSPLAAPSPNPCCPTLCALKSYPSSRAEVTWDVASGVYIWTQPIYIA